MFKENPFVYFGDNPYQEEIWKKVEIDGVKKDYYFVSNYGSLRNVKDQNISPININSGYLVYRLYTGIKAPYKDKYKVCLAHRLVLSTFEPNENISSLTVNHINHNKFDNALWNLNYMTQQENTEDAVIYYHQYGQENIKSCTFSNDQLIVIYNELKKDTPYKEILKMIGVEDTWNNRDYVGNIKRGKTYKRQIEELKMNGFID